MRFLSIAVAAVSLVAGSAAFAQQKDIPQDLLDLDYQRCMKDCEPGFGAATCKPLCECTVAEFNKRLDFSAYLDLSAQLSRNELSPNNRELLDGVANYCASQLEKSGVQVGGPTAGASDQ
ncbi:hypothetical protein [Kordiimonas aestuarii]|uniref:hypothetical protein n=1 Tax=Kordiimonas aestuarii TaxID=1005925 RepID=UPI0021D061E9|nr:hypothetical protein [Kordiimonas aestuarii]